MDTSRLTQPLRVLKRIQETPDAVSLVLEIPPEFKDKYKYEAGQFVSFFLKINGVEISRSYSLSSSPNVDEQFQIAVKKVPGGKASTYLCEQLKEGDILNTTPPAGHFFKLKNQPTHYFLFAAGSGVTPIFSILKRVLTLNSENKVSLLYCNKNENSIIFQNELKDWQTKFPSRFDLIHILSKASPAWQGPSGRANEKLIQNMIKLSDKKLPHEFYMCGPTGFMDLIRTTLFALNVKREQIFEESFGVSAQTLNPTKDPSWTYIGPGSDSGPAEKIIAKLDGQEIEVDVKKGLSILELLMESGANPPYSCMAGACMACMAKVEEGQVYQEDPGILVDENILKCETLTCQAKPLSRVTRISYDNL